MTGADAVVFAQFRDPDKIARILEEFTTRTFEKNSEGKTNVDSMPMMKPGPAVTREQTDAGTAWRVQLSPMFELCYGMVDDHLVVTTSWPRYVAMVEGGPGLAAHLEDSHARSVLESPSGALTYIDFTRPVRDLGPMAPMAGPKGERAVDVLRTVSWTSAGTTYTETGSKSRFVLMLAQPGLWPRLAAMALELE